MAIFGCQDTSALVKPWVTSNTVTADLTQSQDQAPSLFCTAASTGGGEHHVHPHGTARKGFVAGGCPGVLSSSMDLTTHATSWLLFPGTAGEETQNERGEGRAAASVQGQRGDLADEGEGSATGVVIPGAQCYPPKTPKALAKRRCQKETMHCPWDWDLLPSQKAFPACPPSQVAPSRAPCQGSQPSDAGKDTWLEPECGSREAAANTVLSSRNYHQVTGGWDISAWPQSGFTRLASLEIKV